jgi:hypothetical protein
MITQRVTDTARRQVTIVVGIVRYVTRGGGAGRWHAKDTAGLCDLGRREPELVLVTAADESFQRS